MDEYVNGVRSKLVAAASIEGCNQGVRANLDTKECVIANSLFLDWLLENGLHVRNGATLDIITLSFNYGTRSYDDERRHIEALIKKCDPTDEKRLERLNELAAEIDANKDKYVKISKDDLRIKYYTEGVTVTWRFYGGRSTETIKYKMLYRSPGRAKTGKCTFCREELWEKALDFIRMGIKLPDDNAPIVEIGAYSSLITSSIVGRITIPPEDVLILDDVKAVFATDVVSIEVNERNECVAVPRQNYEIGTEMFDGEALIDESVVPKWADGYVLLRQHQTKCAAFITYIQKFFKDHCLEQNIDYETFTLNDKWGNPHLAKNIKLITTTNAIKWLKFGVSYEYWCEKVRENGSMWGVVKTSHPSKMGDVQQMSYQMVNALSIDSMYSVMCPTVEYVQRLQTDDNAFMEYLKRKQNFSNDYEVLIALLEHNPDFKNSEYFKERRSSIIKGYVRNMKIGKLIQNADNLTLVGSPYALLMHAVGLDAHDDPTFENELGTIQCYTERFNDDEYLAEFRNPFNGLSNLGYLHNHWHPYFKKYFNFGKNIIAVNTNGTDFCERNNGSDFDSDGVFTTNQPDIVAHADHCYRNYKTIVNNIPKSTKTFANTLENFAQVDNGLSRAQGAIGSSSNICQWALTYTYNYDDQKYKDYVCILSVLAQAWAGFAETRFKNHSVNSREAKYVSIC